MGVIKSNKTASKTVINGKESFVVKLELESEAMIKDNPKDIVLVLDRSGSMTGAPLDAMKTGAKHFIDIVSTATDGVKNLMLGGDTDIGLVSFAGTATKDLLMTNNVSNMYSTIDRYSASGTTDHQKAIIAGTELSRTGKNADKVMVLFTDGESNPSTEGFAEADAAKAEGIEIYVIGFESKPGGLDINTLNKWASAPASDHVLTSPTYLDIEQMFETLAEKISEPKASKIVLRDTINPCFDIMSAAMPVKGTVKIIDKQTLEWSIDSLGAQGLEKAELNFTVVHNGKCNGVVNVDESYDYNDAEGNTTVLPNPTIEIIGNTTIDVYEDCPVANDIVVPGCTDYVSYDADAITLDGLGRVVEVNTTIKNVCPNKQLALAVVLSEVDNGGVEHARGMKTMLIPAHSETSCVDVKVNCVKFVLPESVDMIGDKDAMCNERQFKARCFANYLDTDYTCCKG